MFGMSDVEDVGCWRCRMFEMCDVRDVGCLGYMMWDTGWLLGWEMLIYKMPTILSVIRDILLKPKRYKRLNNFFG